MITKDDIQRFYDLDAPKTNADLVYEFHEAFAPDQNNGDWSDEVMELRMKLILEEVGEFVQAWRDDLYDGYEEAVVKELVDILYVTYGTLLYLGVDADEAFRRVHGSNMSKLGSDGKPIQRSDGKVLKGPNYREPDLSDLV